MQGGRDTGPRTPKGLDRLRAARTIHGNAGAEPHALKRDRLTLLRRSRVGVAAARYQDHLPPACVAGLDDYAPELMPPPSPTGGNTAQQDRVRRRAMAAVLAPWQPAIAAARGPPRRPRRHPSGKTMHQSAPSPRATPAQQDHAPIRRPA